MTDRPSGDPLRPPPGLPPAPPGGRRGGRRLAWIGTVAGAGLFAISLVVLYVIISEVDAAEFRSAFTAASLRQIGLAVLFTGLSYVLLTGYDALALWQLKLKVPYRTTALASFTSYAVSFNLGFPLITGGTVRYWIYASKGLTAGRVASLTVIANLTFWLGLSLVLGVSLLLEPERLAALTRTNASLNRLIGVALIGAVTAYFVWVSIRRRAVTLQGWRLELPGFRVSLGQALIGAGDVCAGAAVLFVLLPGGHNIGYEVFVAVYVLAAMLGVASHAPGGLGVFEATILLALSSLPREGVLGALLLFRICYYLLPFVVALALLGAYEIRNRMRASRAMLRPEDEAA